MKKWNAPQIKELRISETSKNNGKNYCQGNNPFAGPSGTKMPSGPSGDSGFSGPSGPSGPSGDKRPKKCW